MQSYLSINDILIWQLVNLYNDIKQHYSKHNNNPNHVVGIYQKLFKKNEVH